MNVKLTLIFCISCIILLVSCKEDNNNDDNVPVEDTPVAKEAQFVFKTNFLALWEGIDNADGYLIDVSNSTDFSNFVKGFQEKDVKKVNRVFVFGLEENSSYYYRVRAYSETVNSGYSNVVEVITGNNDQLPNMDFEYWTEYTNYEEPSPHGIWATPNKLVDLLPEFYPSVALKTTDASSGNYAVRVITDSVQGLPLLSGTLASGVFEVNLGNPSKSLTRGVPYFSKPSKFQGYYKYFPVDGDSCHVYAQLSYWDESQAKRVLVGEARLSNNIMEVDEYTFFDIPFEYYNSMQPDSLSMVFVSSAGGEQFVGGVGSTLFVDDVSLIFNE